MYYLCYPDNHVCELSWGGGGWHYNDITATSLGEPARAPASGSALAALVESENLGPRVYYLDTDNHVHELVWCGATRSGTIMGILLPPAVVRLPFP